MITVGQVRQREKERDDEDKEKEKKEREREKSRYSQVEVWDIIFISTLMRGQQQQHQFHEKKKKIAK